MKKARWTWVVGWAVAKVAVVAAVACSSNGSSAPAGADVDAEAASSPSSVPANPTYYADVKPIVDAKCTGCHVPGGIAPFPLVTYDDVSTHADMIGPAVKQRLMPPWPPGQGCTEYAGDRSLPQAMIDTIANWVSTGAPAGDPGAFHPLAGPPGPALSRVDAELRMPDAFTPSVRPDEYRCFLLDWSQTQTMFITGMGAVPGQASIVHHMIVFLAPPAQVATYQAYDDADPGPGYDCFGGPQPNGNAHSAGDAGASPGLPNMLGGWAPGAVGADFPAGTGLRVDPGSKIILQVHYNTLTADPVADQSKLQMKLDPSVTKEARILPWTNPSWPRQHTMGIPAGDPDAGYAFAYDGVSAASLVDGFASGQPFTVYSAALHMHLHGTTTSFHIVHGDGTDECMLDIPRWNFHWQGSFPFAQPKTVSPGDQLRIECHWDNSAANQPIINGAPTPISDLNWGEGTTDEMCIGFLYVTQ
jgi:hypothetical protein